MAISLKTLRTMFGDFRLDDPDLSFARIRNAIVAYERGELRMCSVLSICDRELGGHGVEAIRNPLDSDNYLADYVNMGDTYAPTILYCYRTERFVATDWGSYYERSPEYRKHSLAEYRAEMSNREVAS